MQYTGVAQGIGNMQVDSRVIIDTQAYNTFNPQKPIYVRALAKDRSYIPPPLIIDEDEPANKNLTPMATPPRHESTACLLAQGQSMYHHLCFWNP